MRWRGALPSLVLSLTPLVACRVVPAHVEPAADWGPLGGEPEVHRLDNGLTWVTVPWPSPGIVAYFTLVRVGARDEVEPGHSGFAHLFEHMMFRGTKRYPEAEYERAVQALGVDNNAFTTRDYTLYTNTAPRGALAELMALEADRFQHLQYSEAQFRAETGAVLGEYNKSAASPELKMWETLNELAFQQHTYRHTTLGTLEDIEAMPGRYAYSLKFFRRFYTPDDTTLLVVGDFDPQAVQHLVEQHYGGWRGRRDEPVVPTEPAPTEGARCDLTWEGESEARLMIGYRGPAFGNQPDAQALSDVAALEVLRGMAFGESSPLVERYVLRERSALELGSWPEDFNRDPGLFVVSARLAPGRSFTELVEGVQTTLDAFARGEVDPVRLRAVSSHLRYAATMAIETPEDAAELLASFAAVSGGIRALPAYLAALAQVKATDVQRVAGRYLGERRRFVVTLRPRETP